MPYVTRREKMAKHLKEGDVIQIIGAYMSWPRGSMAARQDFDMGSWTKVEEVLFPDYLEAMILFEDHEDHWRVDEMGPLAEEVSRLSDAMVLSVITPETDSDNYYERRYFKVSTYKPITVLVETEH